MKRKVIRQGNDVLTVTLPKAWTRRFNLKAGNEIDVEERGNSLSISATPMTEVEVVDVNLKGVEEIADYFLGSLLKRGVDELHYSFDNPIAFDKIMKHLSEEVVGFELISRKKDSCIIKEVSHAKEIDFEIILRRIFLMMHEMAKDIASSISSDSLEQLPSIALVEMTNNRFTNILRRHLVKFGYSDYNKTIFYYHIVDMLEKACDTLKFVCQYFSGKDKLELSKEYKNIFGSIASFFATYEGIFFNFSKEAVLDFYNDRKKLIKTGYSLLEKAKSPDEKIVAHFTLVILQQIFSMVSSTIAIRV